MLFYTPPPISCFRLYILKVREVFHSVEVAKKFISCFVRRYRKTHMNFLANPIF